MTNRQKTPSWLPVLILAGLGISVIPHPVLTRTSEVSRALNPVLSSYEVIRMEPGEIEQQVRTTGELRLRFDETDFYFNLEPHDLRAPGYRAVETGPGGVRRTLPPQPVHTFKGVLAGREDIRGRFNLTDGGVEGVVYAPEGWVYVEPLRNYLPGALAGELVVYSHSDIKPGEPWECSVSLPDRLQQGVNHVEAQVEAGPATNYVVDVATEADYEYVQALGGSEEANREIEGILNQVDGVYQSELLLQLRISFQHAWATEDPYDKTSKHACLHDFRDYWNNNFADSQIYDLAHLWTGKARIFGGSATRGVVCRSPSSSYGLSTALSGNLGKYALAAHEIGHNFGATHPNDRTPPIAGCFNTIMWQSAATRSGLTFCEFSRQQIASHVARHNSCLTTQPVTLQPPSDLTATAVSNSGIGLSWQDRSTNETGFRLQRRPVEGDVWMQIGTTAANATTFTSRGLFPAVTYRYRAQAFNQTESSTFSNEAVATTQSGPLTRTYWKIDTIAGGGVGDGGAAVSARLDNPTGVVVDGAGNLYVADSDNHRVRKIDASGTITTVAGTGEQGSNEDGGPAVSAQLHSPTGVTVDGSGNLYIADSDNHRVRKIDASGTITTVAGTGEQGFSGDGGQAIGAQLSHPSGVALDSVGNLYIADRWNNRIRRIDTTGTITTIAGTGGRGFSGDGGTAVAARLHYPGGVVVDGSGNVYVADGSNHRIRRIDTTGTITTIAGTGEEGFSGDGGQAFGAQLNLPSGVALDSIGNLYVADSDNHRIRRIDASGTITTFAGHGEPASNLDGILAINSRLNLPRGVAVDGSGNLYIADTGNDRIRRVNPSGTINSIAGNGDPGTNEDGRPAVAARLNFPGGVAVDSAGNVFVDGTSSSWIRRIDATGTITTLAGPSVGARPLAVDGADNLFVTLNHQIQRIDTTGTITTIAGTGDRGFSGDGGPAVAAQLYQPGGMAVDGAGNLYIADTYNNRIRQVDTTGTITTIAGTGERGFSGDGGSAVAAQLYLPAGVAVDSAGNLYIADSYNDRIRQVDLTGTITTIAGTGERGFSGDGGSAVAAQLYLPAGVAVDSVGNLYIAGNYNHRIRRVDPSGTITTFAGTGNKGFSGDGGPAVTAQINRPEGVAVDGSGNVYIADTSNHRIRIVTLTTTPNSLHPPSGLTATPVSSSGVVLSWEDNSNNETGFRVQRRQGDSDDWVQVGTTATNATTFSDGGLLPETLYFYRVQAFNDTRSSTFSNQVMVTTSSLHPPSGLTAIPVSSSRINLNWQDNSVSETGFKVQRQRDGLSDWAPVGTTAAAATLFSDTGLLPGTRYRYRVQAFNQSESSAFSNQAVATTRSVHPPRGLTARAISSSGIDLSWQDNNIHETGFRVQRRQDGASLWLPIGTTAANATTFLDVGLLLPGTGYRYRVQAFNETESSVFSNEAAATTLSAAPTQDSWKIDTIAGGSVGDGSPAVAATVYRPSGVAVDGSGNLYIADTDNNRIRRVDRSGTITTIAGTGEQGFSGDGGAAVAAQLSLPSGVAVDAAGNLYIADRYNHRIRRVDRFGTITTIAGTGGRGYSGDGGPAVAAQLNSPSDVAVNGNGNLYITDTENHRIRRIDDTGVITTIAGTGEESYGGDNGPAVAARLDFPAAVVVDVAGNLYIVDSGNHRIRRVDSTGMITTIAGNGELGFSGDGGPAVAAHLLYPTGIAVDGAGNLYVADTDNHRIRRINSSGTITTIAGTGEQGFGGDNGPAVEAQLAGPQGMAVDGAGNVYIADFGNHRIRRVDGSGTISTIAGTGEQGSSGDGGPAVAAQLNAPNGVAVDGSGNVYIADTENHRIRRVNVTGTISTFAGTGEGGYSGDGGPPVAAQLHSPRGVAVDGSGNVYIADTENHRIRQVNVTGTISTFAGTGEGYSGDGGPAVAAQLHSPSSVAVDGAGNVYVADFFNSRIRRVDISGTISTIAGTGRRGYSGDGGPAVAAQLHSPSSVAVDGAGNVYVADFFNSRIRRVDISGTISTIAGTGEGGYSGDGGPAVSAQLGDAKGVAVDSAGNLYIADRRIRRVDPLGIITTFAGGGGWGFSGDRGPAVQARLRTPEGMAVDGVGNVYIADTGNHRIRIVTPASPVDRLQAPTGLTVKVVSSSGVNLSWQDNSDNETGFKVQRRRDGSGDWVQVGTTARNSTAFSDAGLKPTTTYHYRVQAFNDTQSSFFSNEVVAITVGLAPTVAGFVPMAGPVGTRVTLTGTYFLGATAVRFNRVSAVEFEVVSGTSIEAVVPRRATSGPISVVTPEGTAVSADTFTVVPPPTLTRFTPATGPVGTRVTLTGTYFLGATAVRFNRVSAVEFEVVSGTSIEAVVPPGATSGPISVVTPGGMAVSTEPFTVVPPPTLTGFTPATGPAGTRVTLTGTHFLGATDVRFNGVSAVEFEVVSGRSIEAVVPPGATSGPISVVTPGGTAVSAEPFTVVFPPTLTRFTPATGPVGTRVTLTGTYFLGATDVRFNGVSAVVFEVVSGTTIEAVVPPGATSGPISVVTPGGTAVSAEPFTVVPPPTLTRFTPATGPPGTRVTLTGTHFLGATDVRFNRVSAVVFEVVSGTTIEAVVPRRATSGPISVVTPGGTAVSTEPFTVVPPPTLTGFTPATGPAGTGVTLTGTHFLGATAVRFNGVGAVEFEVVSGRSIEAVVPRGATSGPISVVTPGGMAVSAEPFTVTTGIRSRLFVPVVLRSQGRTPGSFFTSELTLTNRGSTTAEIHYTYRASFGGGSGTAVDSLGPGRQRIIPAAIAYLTSLGVPIREGAAGGTLVVDFSNLSSESAAAVTVRTSTPVEDGGGQAGLAYLGVTPEDLLTGTSVIAGLRQNRMDRSNLAVQNAGDPSDGAITLRVTVYSGDPETPGSLVLPELSLPPGGFHQYNGILTEAGFENGYVKVERVRGTAAYYAYGVINDNFNSDGSFVFPVTESSLVGTSSQTLSVIVETRDFTSELTVTNFSDRARTLDLRFVADAIDTDGAATFSLTLQAGEQSILSNLVDHLRGQEVTGIGPAGRAFAGALFARVSEGDMSGIVIGARTGSPGGGGQYGVFYNAVPDGSASTGSAWIYGLQQNATNRSNLALVNTGEVDDSDSLFSLDIYDGETGNLVRTISRTVPPRGWHQINGILGAYARGTQQGYVRIRKLPGNNPFLAYGVINDGGAPGQRSGDGAFLPSQ